MERIIGREKGGKHGTSMGLMGGSDTTALAGTSAGANRPIFPHLLFSTTFICSKLPRIDLSYLEILDYRSTSALRDV